MEEVVGAGEAVVVVVVVVVPFSEFDDLLFLRNPTASKPGKLNDFIHTEMCPTHHAIIEDYRLAYESPT